MPSDFSQPVSFERYMELCLYHPEWGYYRRDRGAILGRDGDFYTSPHTHESFAHCLSEELVHWFEVLNRPESFQVCELGAADGRLAGQIRDYLRAVHPAIEERLEYLEIDIERGELPDAVEGVILSNELFDALPVRRVLFQEDSLWEIFVQSRDGRLEESLIPLDDPLVESYLKEAFERLRPGWTYEINGRAQELLRRIDGRLARGCVLTIDYGYVGADYERVASPRGTVACYHRHRVSDDPYQRPGEQDMTCHVHFGMLMQWGEELGWRTGPLISQRDFLVGRGILERLESEQEYGLFRADRLEDRLALKDLLVPGGISDHMKVLVQEVRLDRGEADRVVRN